MLLGFDLVEYDCEHGGRSKGVTEEPLISVIVPVYNVSAYLDKSMNTLVTQTYQNLEIIMVDDGSKDNSGDLCDIWAKKDSRIRVIHQENGGLSQARNTGLDVMTGEYVMFFDSDDLLSPDICRVLYDAIREGGDISICDPEHIFGTQPYSFVRNSQQEVLTAENAVKQMWYQTGLLPSAWAKLYRRGIFSNLRFTPGLRFEDIDILHELLWKAERIVYNHSRLYGYLHRENSITTSAFSVKDTDILKVADKILRFAQDKPEIYRAAEAYVTTSALRVYLNAPNDDCYIDALSKAEAMLCNHGKQVLRDKYARRKNRVALLLYFYCKPLLRFMYRYVRRW